MLKNLESKVNDSINYRSSGERKIADILEKYKIDFEYEKPVLINDEHNLQRIWYPDFYLPEFNIYIEYYGVTGDDDYNIGMIKKSFLYQQQGLDIIPVYPANINNGLSSYVMNNIGYNLARRNSLFDNKMHNYK